MSNNPPPNPLSNTYVPSAWEQEDTAITKENIGLYAVKFPISQNSPITISNTLSVGGLITGATTTQTANDNSTYSGNNNYTGNTTMNTLFTPLIDTTNALNNLSIAENPTRTGGINIYTQGDSFTASTIKIGKASVTTTELNGTTNLNGAVNATSTDNKTIGSTSGGNNTTKWNNSN
jgi:hypothetical protein